MTRKQKEDLLYQQLRKLQYKSFQELKKHTPTGTPIGLIPLLRCVEKNPMATQQELADKLFLTKAALSQWLIKLEEEGYVERKTNLFDKREKWVDLTPHGKIFLQDTTLVLEQRLHELFSSLSEKELDILEELLTKVTGGNND